MNLYVHFLVKKKKISGPVFVNVYRTQESIPGNQFRQPGNRFLGSLKGLQIRAQLIILFWYTFVKQFTATITVNIQQIYAIANLHNNVNSTRRILLEG